MNNPGKRFFLAALLTLSMAGARAQSVELEYQVKASYLYNFVRFVTWPHDVFGSDNRFNLCVVGAERFGRTLDSLAGEQVENRKIVILRLEQSSQARAARCHLLFIAAGLGAEGIDAERGMLTISESAGFLNRGGMINLIENRGRIRFEINQAAAQRAGLAVSSRLLDLATKRP